ncbi:hypothetical protein [Bradyrhizobium sp. Ghvi]|uniref:hypothetical protein n=1 Tax=Bradyrhizobium sp. Ghvi TaxID=1855319 RepID=UPI0015A4F8DF|nr:hypothetical protein [Bradyrhizobium sp. Ghvi]
MAVWIASSLYFAMTETWRNGRGSKAIQTTPPQDWIARLPSASQSRRIRRDRSRSLNVAAFGAAASNALEQSSSFSPSSSGAPQCRQMRADNDGALPLAAI